MAAEAGKKSGVKKPAIKKDRTAIKATLKSLKKSREEAKEAKDAKLLERIRRDYRRATHSLRKSAPPKAKAAKKK